MYRKETRMELDQKAEGYTDQCTGRLPPSHYTAITETHPADWGSFSGHYVYRNCHCCNRVVPNLLLYNTEQRG